MRYHVGCMGWKNHVWAKEFYPPVLNPKDYLSYYSKVFDFVHIDLNNNKFLPKRTTINRWNSETPSHFRFTIKTPKNITDSKIRTDLEKSFGEFLEDLAILEEKIISIVIEPPEITSLDEGRDWLNKILSDCTYHGFSVAFEFNQSFWHQDLTYNLLSKHKSSFVWSTSGYRYYYPTVTSDFIFLKVNTNFSISKEIDDLKKWIEKIKEKEKKIASSTEWDEQLNDAILVVDSPHKVNQVLKLLDLPEKKIIKYIQHDQEYYDQSIWTGKLIIHVDLNAFFPSCEELRDPSLKGKPHAVIMTDEKEGSITRGAVASCSYEARKYGVSSAMSLIKAKELCPGLILKPVDKQYYNNVSEKVMRILEDYADVLEQASIDEAYLDCTSKVLVSKNSRSSIEGNDQRSFSVKEYARAIKDSVREQCNGLLCSIGVAPTKAVAKIASDFKKPDGLTIIYSNQLSKFLKPLKVDRIAGIGVKTAQSLNEMGVKTIGQLAECNVQELIDRFGKRNGIWMWHVANGIENDKVISKEDHISLSTEETLEKPTKSKENLLKHFYRLVDELFKRISYRGYEFRTVGIKLVRSDFTIETREISYSNYQNKKESISSVIGQLLDKSNLQANLTYNNRPAIRKIGIKVSHLIRKEKKNSPQQKTLLDYI